MKTLFAILFTLIAFIGGFGIGLGGLAWSIYLIVCMVKGTVAASFLNILWCVVLWILSPICGWIWGILWAMAASACAA